jgi:hypothetical protein
MHADDVIEMPGGTGYNVFAGLREKCLLISAKVPLFCMTVLMP